MKSSWTVASVVEFLTSKGFKKKDIAGRIKKTPAYLSRMINGKSEETKTILSMLLMAFHDEIHGIPKPPHGDPINEDRALIKALYYEIAKMKSEKEGISFDEAVEEIKKNTNLVKTLDLGM